jgi:hypothetical protein
MSEPAICYTYPQPLTQKSATSPGSNFNQQGGSIFNQRRHKADMEAVKNEDYNFPDWSNHLASLHEYVADSFIPFACNSALGKIGVNCFDRFDSRQDVWVGDLTQSERRIIGDYLVFSGKPAAASLLAYRYEENWRGYLLGIESGRFSVPSSLLALWDCPPAIVRLSQALELRARTEEHQRSKHNEDHADDEDDFTF